MIMKMIIINTAATSNPTIIPTINATFGLSFPFLSLFLISVVAVGFIPDDVKDMADEEYVGIIKLLFVLEIILLVVAV